MHQKTGGKIDKDVFSSYKMILGGLTPFYFSHINALRLDKNNDCYAFADFSRASLILYIVLHLDC